jgi:O-antigen/teichoic acid export membrane protein
MIGRLRSRLPRTSSEHLAIVRDFSWYSIANVLSLLLLLGTALLLRRYLGPYFAGIWTALELIPLYATYAHVGVLSAAERELPYLAGAGRTEDLRRHRSTVYWFAQMLGAGAGLAVAAAGVLLRDRVSHESSTGLIVYGWLVYVQVVSSCYLVFYRTAKRFVALSSRQAVANVAKAAATLAGGAAAGIYGVYAGLAVGAAIQLWLLRAAVDERLPWRFDRRVLRPLVQAGFPILAIGVAFDTMRTADRLGIAAVLGAEPLGVYSVAALVAQGLFYLPNALTIVLYPRLQERFGATGDPATLRRMLELPLSVVSDALLIVCAATAILLPPFVRVWMPQFTDAVRPAMILLVAVYFASLSTFPAQTLLTLRAEGRLLLVSVAAMLAALGGAWWAARSGLTVVAAVVGAAAVAYCLLVNAAALRALSTARWASRLGALSGRPTAALLAVVAIALAPGPEHWWRPLVIALLALSSGLRLWRRFLAGVDAAI